MGGVLKSPAPLLPILEGRLNCDARLGGVCCDEVGRVCCVDRLGEACCDVVGGVCCVKRLGGACCVPNTKGLLLPMLKLNPPGLASPGENDIDLVKEGNPEPDNNGLPVEEPLASDGANKLPLEDIVGCVDVLVLDIAVVELVLVIDGGTNPKAGGTGPVDEVLEDVMGVASNGPLGLVADT